MLESHNRTNFPSASSRANPVTVAALPGEKVTLRGAVAIGIETPMTLYVIFHGIIIYNNMAWKNLHGININNIGNNAR